MIKPKHIKLSLRSFLIYTSCFALPLVLITLNHTLSRIQQRRDDYAASRQVVAEHLDQVILSQFDLIEEAANEIYLSGWYKKHISVSPVYRQEFNIVRQLEIAGDLRHSVSLLTFAEDILIFNTRDWSMICKYGWFGSVVKYAEVYCQMDLDRLPESLRHTSLLSPIRSLDDRFFILSYPDPSRGSACRIGILIRRSAFEEYLDSIHYNGEFSSISVLLEDQLLLRHEVADSTDNKTSTISLSSPGPAFVMLFEYPDFDALYYQDSVDQLLINIVMALAAGIALAFLLTKLFAVPLERLLLSVSPSPYAGYRQAFDQVSSHISDITRRNQQLTHEMDRFTDELRNQMLISLLTREGSLSSEHGTINRIFPWLASDKPYFLILLQGSADPTRIMPPALQGDPESSLIRLDLPLAYTGYLCVQGSAEQAEALSQRLRDRLPAGQAACSWVHTGYAGLNACYREAVSRIDVRRSGLSLADTLSLINHLQLGDAVRCRQALQPYVLTEDEDLQSQVLSLLDRWSNENGLTPPGSEPDRGDGLSGWAEVEAQIDRLCSRMVPAQTSRCSSIISAVNDYLDEFYCLPDISLKYLSDQFNISVGALSRMYKQETGRNFSTVLLELRMTKAKELLTVTSDSITSISAACGYENYISFKRAFTRMESISPREYREAGLSAPA